MYICIYMYIYVYIYIYIRAFVIHWSSFSIHHWPFSMGHSSVHRIFPFLCVSVYVCVRVFVSVCVCWCLSLCLCVLVSLCCECVRVCEDVRFQGRCCLCTTKLITAGILTTFIWILFLVYGIAGILLLKRF